MLSALAFLGLALAASAQHNWAVLVAGSSGYGNYRHHADLCHAYKILSENGVPAAHIITMLYDDVAQDPDNPYMGQLFNAPTDDNVTGVDVYAGCKKSYTGESVTASNFLAILTGNASGVVGGSGEVLRSGPDDRVFVNFVDHGGSGLIAFPVGDYLYSDQLNGALATMARTSLFGQLAFYLEACESGSMFEGLLPPNISIYATTAANADESSWGCYCPPGDSVQGQHLNTCLGDLYSVNWMESVDAPWRMQQSLQDNFVLVQAETNLSHVMQYGDQRFATADPMSAFLTGWFGTSGNGKVWQGRPGHRAPSPAGYPTASARLATILSLEARAAAGSKLAPPLLVTERRAMAVAGRAFERLVGPLVSIEEALEQPLDLGVGFSWPCYRAGMAAFESSCGRFTDATLELARLVARQCAKAGGDGSRVAAEVSAACATPPEL